MHKFREFFQPQLAAILEKYRKELGLTQTKLAEYLAISTRYYSDLKKGKSLLGAIELILLMKLLPVEKKLQLILDLEELTESREFQACLCKIDFI